MSPGQSLSGWGRHPQVMGRLITPDDTLGATAVIIAEPELTARGNGRAYGDAAINPLATLGMRGCSRVIAFDPTNGVITAEAGLLLADMIDLVLPHGWFPPVTPGTKFVTLGGMLAADVHGKNHHVAGSFGAHVISCDLALADGSVRRCSPRENALLFAATSGGMGLTGVILRLTVQLLRVETPMIRQRTLRAANLTEAMAAFESNLDVTYSVAWIDCLARGASLGRALVYLGEHARGDDQVYRSDTGRVEVNNRKLVFGSVGKKDGWDDVQRLLQENVLQAEDRLEITVKSPKASLDALGRIRT